MKILYLNGQPVNIGLLTDANGLAKLLSEFPDVLLENEGMAEARQKRNADGFYSENEVKKEIPLTTQ